MSDWPRRSSSSDFTRPYGRLPRNTDPEGPSVAEKTQGMRQKPAAEAAGGASAAPSFIATAELGPHRRPRPPPTVDYLGRLGAEQLAEQIRAYWSGLGHDQVNVWIEPAHSGTWAVRSNLARGLPPQQPPLKGRLHEARLHRSASPKEVLGYPL